MSKILLLEDDPHFRFTIESALAMDGHDVHAVSTLDDAINYLRFQKPDLLILDYLISNQNSLQVADFALYSSPDVPVIYVTGSGMFADGQLFNMARNVAWVLRKPVKMADLRDITQYSLERQFPEKSFAMA